MNIVREWRDGPWLRESDLIEGHVYMTTGTSDDELDGAFYIYTQDGTLVQLEDGYVERPREEWKFVEVGAHLVVE